MTGLTSTFIEKRHFQIIPDFTHLSDPCFRGNIKPGVQRNFAKAYPGYINTHDIPYDYYSIMHYKRNVSYVKTSMLNNEQNEQWVKLSHYY